MTSVRPLFFMDPRRGLCQKYVNYFALFDLHSKKEDESGEQWYYILVSDLHNNKLRSVVCCACAIRDRIMTSQLLCMDSEITIILQGKFTSCLIFNYHYHYFNLSNSQCGCTFYH